jgi:hypothetical protein
MDHNDDRLILITSLFFFFEGMNTKSRKNTLTRARTRLLSWFQKKSKEFVLPSEHVMGRVLFLCNVVCLELLPFKNSRRVHFFHIASQEIT